MNDLRRARLYSEELGIDLKKDSDGELFKWFLASKLFGARITERIAANTYKAFERYRLLSPEDILNAGWDFLVNPIMREGGYVRYDERTSRQILRDCETLLAEYGGSLKRLHAVAKDSRDLEARLDRFYGVGPITINIFLRELRTVWSKADPEPLPIVREQAAAEGIDLSRMNRKTMTFVRLEAGLIRARKTPRQAA
ncbi:MAG: hypothetical protein Q8L35_00895 [Actinomycetota bacterium]|nr:hypothetical protein [Actinomycetota bacterium]